MGLYRPLDANAEVNVGVYQERGVSSLPQTQCHSVIPGLGLEKGDSPYPGTEIHRYALFMFIYFI